jgi:hypothetical protein
LTIKFTLDTEFFLYFSKLPLKQCRLSTIRRRLRSPPYIGLMVEYILMLYTAPFRRLSRGLLYTARQNIQFSKIDFDCHSAIKTLYSPYRRIQSPDFCILVFFISAVSGGPG